MEDQEVDPNPTVDEVEQIAVEPLRSFFWMSAVDLIYTVEGGLAKVRKVNVLTRTAAPYINQLTLGNIQKAAQIQAMEHKKIPRKAKIEDVIVNGPWMIGHMTDEEFQYQSETQEPIPDEVEVAGAPKSEG